MKKIFLFLSLLIAFCLGYGFNQATNENTVYLQPKKRVTSVGGIFFKCKDPQKMRDWYSRHLGLQTDKYGTNFEWYQGSDSTKKGFTQWSPFKETTKYFEPSTKDFMLNYRVENMSRLMDQLKKE